MIQDFLSSNLFLVAIDANLSKFVILAIIIIGLGAILRMLKQPFVIAYIIAGVLLGEHGFQVITDDVLIGSMGEFGLILLLFFIGMEISLPDLMKHWKIALIGTPSQVIFSIGLVSLIGSYFDWEWNRIIVLGFIISLSSSAVIIKLLQDTQQVGSPVGQNVLNILLTQDVLIVPMLIITNYVGGTQPTWGEISLQIIGGILVILFMGWILRKKEIRLPYSEQIESDHELQVFIAFFICFGFAVLTSFFHLSAALGAFLAGILVHAARSTEWFHDSLHAFRVVFVAIFFVSIGMLIDMNFLYENFAIIGTLLLAVYISNHFINSFILRLFKCTWKDAIYGGAMLAQVGELSFIIVAIAFKDQIISEFSYQVTLIVIALTLLISPFWISITRLLLKKF